MSKREKWAITGCLFVLATLLADRLVIGPVHDQMQLLEIRVHDEETAVKKSLHVLLRKEHILAEIKEFAGFAVEGKSSEEELTIFLKDIETLASQASVSLLYVKPGVAKAEGSVRKYAASLECEGQMEEIIDFFYRIESSPHLLKIVKYTLEPKSKESTIVRCTMTVARAVLP